MPAEEHEEPSRKPTPDAPEDEVAGVADDAEERGSHRYPTDSAGSRPSSSYADSPDAAPGRGTDLDRIFAEAEDNRARREEQRSPAVWLPDGGDLDSEPEMNDDVGFTREDYAGRGSRQLGLRLRPTHFDRLCQVAELYGVRPTTLARMMVIRGVNAVLDAENRRRAKMLDE